MNLLHAHLGYQKDPTSLFIKNNDLPEMLIFIILCIQFIINTAETQITRCKSYVAWCPGPPAVLVSVSVAASAEVLPKENIDSCVSMVSS